MNDTDLKTLPPAGQVATKKIALEVAEQWFDNWAEAMDLDLDEQFMDEDGIQTFGKIKRRLIKVICDGKLTFNDDGEAVYKPKNMEAITFPECNGAAIMAMDGKKKGHDVEKLYAVMADSCGVPRGTFSKLKGIDWKITTSIFNLLMD